MTPMFRGVFAWSRWPKRRTSWESPAWPGRGGRLARPGLRLTWLGPRPVRLVPLGVALGLVWCVTGAALAQEPLVTSAPGDSLRYRLVEPVTTEAPRPVTTTGGAAAVEVNVDSLEVPAAASVEEVLREMPMLHVRTNSRGEAELSARGSESRQVAVLVDGIPITLAWDARADVSVLPATSVQEVFFVRGLSSMLYGPNVLGGIVEARIGRTLSQPDRASTQVGVGVDHLGAFGTTVSTTQPFETEDGEWLIRGGLGFRDSPGDPRADGVEEPIPTDDDLRLNTDTQNIDGFVAVRYQTEDGAYLSFSGSSFRAERGVAAELGVSDEDARLWRYPHVSRTLGVVSAGTGFRSSPLGGRGDVEASFGVDVGRFEIDEYGTRDYDEVTSFENGEDRTLTFRLLSDQTLGDRGDLRAAFTVSDIRHDETLEDGAFEYAQRLWSLGLENAWRLVQGRGVFDALTVTVGGAYDRGSTPKSGGRESLGTLSEWGGRAGLSAVLDDGRVVAHAGVSRRGRFPALRELYSGALDRFEPNPELRPETLTTFETGATVRLPHGEVQAVGFFNRLNDAVVRITLEDRKFKRVNRDELRSFGLELLGSYVVGPVHFSSDLTVQDVELTDPRADESQRPENLPEVFGQLDARLFVGYQWSAGAGLAYTGSQFCIDPSGEDVTLEGEAVVGMHVSREWEVDLPWGGGEFRHLETRLSVDNVGDVALYDACALPEPGRRVRLQLRLY